MLKLAAILKELNLTKNKWTPVPHNELDQFKEQIFQLINTAYTSIGGHPNYRSANDVEKEASNTDFEVIDLDDTPGIDAVDAYKNTPAGVKFVAIGQNGSTAAKSAVINRNADLLKHRGYYVEVSGKIKDIFLSKGVQPVDDEASVRKVLKGKQIEWHGDGTYTRNIAGTAHRKMLLGKPNV
jgi:hypothetical protein